METLSTEWHTTKTDYCTLRKGGPKVHLHRPDLEVNILAHVDDIAPMVENEYYSRNEMI